MPSRALHLLITAPSLQQVQSRHQNSIPFESQFQPKVQLAIMAPKIAIVFVSFQATLPNYIHLGITMHVADVAYTNTVGAVLNVRTHR
jgi:hypothetical protein